MILLSGANERISEEKTKIFLCFFERKSEKKTLHNGMSLLFYYYYLVSVANIVSDSWLV